MTITTQKNITRAKTVKEMIDIFGNFYGKENVYIIGDSEIAVKVDETENGEPIFATFSPTVKDFQNRKTPKKIIPKFDPVTLAKNWEEKVKQRETEKEENAKAKAAKIAKDKELRLKRKREKEEAR